jgi:hypothetical protein
MLFGEIVYFGCLIVMLILIDFIVFLRLNKKTSLFPVIKFAIFSSVLVTVLTMMVTNICGYLSSPSSSCTCPRWIMALFILGFWTFIFNLLLTFCVGILYKKSKKIQKLVKHYVK